MTETKSDRWTFSGDIDNASIARDGETLFEAVRIGGCESDPWGYPYDDAEKDGTEIVRMLNAHDDLLAVLKRIIDRATAHMSNGDIDYGDVEAARAAIAKAESH